MKDKVCVVTGANSGIGFETAKALAMQGAQVFMLGRNRSKLEAAIQKIKDEKPDARTFLVVVNLAVQDEIRKAARVILDQSEKVDVLVNNAGTWFSELTLTKEKVEMQFAVNHLAYFLLTCELLPGLVKAEEGRVINVASDSHFQGKMHFNDLNLTKKYHGLRAYAQSKLANVLFTYEFDRRKPFENITINAVQPGLVKTDIGLKHTFSLHGLAWKIRRLGGVKPHKGAETSIYLASSDQVKGESGKYWDKSKPKDSSKNSYNQSDAKKLWQISLDLCGIDSYFELKEKA
ncbi:MAG: SDR family oxidoreductase [Candidatus Cyclobacteriaceae bacterium M3_2C_046]